MTLKETLKEAKKYLENAQIYMARITGMSMNDPLYRAFDLALIALDKQIPKKINTRSSPYGERDFCPVCGCVIENCHAYFCIRCGQALKEDKEKEKT